MKKKQKQKKQTKNKHKLVASKKLEKARKELIPKASRKKYIQLC